MDRKANRDLDTIALTGIRADCFIGIHPHERDRRQPLLVDLELKLMTWPAARRGKLTRSVDYSLVCAEVRFLLEACRFRLLETAAEAVASYLLAPPPAERRQARIDAVRISMSKPEALPGGVLVSLTVERQASDFQFTVEENNPVKVDLIHVSKDCGIYRLRLPPGGVIPPHVHAAMDEAEMAMSDGLLLQGRPLAAGIAHFWPRNFPHSYSNPTAEERTVLCVDRPKFIPEDEKLVAIDIADLPEPPADCAIDFYKLGGHVR